MNSEHVVILSAAKDLNRHVCTMCANVEILRVPVGNRDTQNDIS
jgi:hypothetical protein